LRHNSALETSEIGVNDGACQFAPSVAAEVEVDNCVTALDVARRLVARYYDRDNKFVTHPRII
jgi:hypothetical protein